MSHHHIGFTIPKSQNNLIFEYVFNRALLLSVQEVVTHFNSKLLLRGKNIVPLQIYDQLRSSWKLLGYPYICMYISEG